MLKKFSFISLFFCIILLINIAQASNVKNPCVNNLQPVYATEDTDVESVSGGSGADGKKYVNEDGEVYYFKDEPELSFHLILMDKTKHSVTKDKLFNDTYSYYKYLYIYNNLIEPYIIPFGKKSFSFKKGDIIGCIDDIKNLEYFKVKCYISQDHACWDEWE